MGSERIKSTSIITESEYKTSKMDKSVNSRISLSLRDVEIITGEVKVLFSVKKDWTHGRENGNGLWFFSIGLLVLFDFFKRCMFYFDLKKNVVVLPFRKVF